MDKNGEHLYFAGLLAKYIQGLASDEDIMRLKKYMNENPRIAQMLVDSIDNDLLDQNLEELQQIDLKQQWAGFEEKRVTKSIVRRPALPVVIWLSAAAAVLIVAITLLLNRHLESNTTIIPDHYFGYKNDVTPGRDRATLTLADGRVIDLGGTEGGGMGMDTGYIHIADGFVEFKDQRSLAAYKPNRIQTPKGGTFQTILSDGTKIWLNSNSEIEFPAQFSETERRIKLISGEAFFEVAKNKQKPFIVETQRYSVQVTGTAFNINNYEDNVVKTLLTEGSVHVVSKQMITSLHPGQAVVNNGESLQMTKADVNEALSWREGYFYFDGKTLSEILAELSRWYDVEIEYQIALDQTTYMGGAKRSNTLGNLCKMLTDMSQHEFEINGKKLIVKK